jgi:hypothetical protein
LTGNLSVGPEGIVGTLPYGPRNNALYWVVPEVIAAYKVSDELTATADVVYGYAAQQSQWYGIAGYASYAFNSMFTPQLRIEWYHDGHGATTGAGGLDANAFTGVGRDINFYEGTAGVQITPLPNDNILKNLMVRPELRGDDATKRVLDTHGGASNSGHYTELTFAVDAIMKY